jgi:16S rRNA (guanine966-N2)-methyltransferase
MRITAGTHKGRAIFAPEGADIRPTADKVRQAVFNMLGSCGLPDNETLALDIFCGTGALGLEALSRGAARALFIDKGENAIAACRRNIKTMGLESRASVIAADATRLASPPFGTPPARLAFVDPPYRQGLVPVTLTLLAERGWLAPGALCVAEMEKEAQTTAPPGFTRLDTRHYGVTQIAFYRFDGEGGG